jgi:hypothetical protein
MDERVQFDPDRDDVEITADAGWGDAYSLREIQRRMRHPDPERAARWARLWHASWDIALERARTYNRRDLIQWMLDTGEPVPADVVRALLALRFKPGRPPIPASPEDVVTRVQEAILRGHRWPDCLKVVAADLGCGQDAVLKKWNDYPKTWRDDLRAEVKEAEIVIKDAPLLGK